MPINRDRYKREADQARARSGGGRMLRLEDGVNKIRILKFRHKVAEIDFTLGRYADVDRAAGVKVGSTVEELNVHSTVHFLEGAFKDYPGRRFLFR